MRLPDPDRREHMDSGATMSVKVSSSSDYQIWSGLHITRPIGLLPDPL